MRKVLSFVLVLSLVLGSFGMAFAVETTTPKDVALSDIDGLACEDAVRVLTSLDVVSGYEDGTYKPEQTVTRAEMASLIIKALGLKETDAVPKFTDSKTHWAKGYIAYANTLGIISGRSETTFDPDATVTYDEATTMLIKALGYTDESLNGTYPASFVSRARVLGILDGVQTGSGGANRGDIAIMLYQTLDLAIGKVDKDGNFQETVTKYNNAGIATEYDTMLARLGAELYEAANAYQRPDVDDDAFLLTGDEDAIVNIRPYTGAVVSAYVNDDDDIIAIKEVFTTFVSGKFDNSNFNTDTPFILADGTEYTLKQDALNQIANTSGSSVIGAVDFENGDVGNDYGSTITATDTVYTLSVELSGKKITDVYAVMRWEMKDGTMVDADDINDIEANHKLLGVEFDETNDGDIDLESFELFGVSSLSDIKEDNVVYVYENSDKYVSRVMVGTTTVSGEVTKQNSSQTKITIDGTQYKYASEELKGNEIVSDAVSKTKIDTGDEVKLYLDAYGYIYDYDEISGSADQYAVVLDLEDKDGNKISSSAKVKLFLADGTYKTFDVDEDDVQDAGIIGSSDSDTVTTAATNFGVASTVNGVGNESSVDGLWNQAIQRGTILKYGLDKDGTITSLEAGNAADPDNQLEVVTNSGIDITSKGYYGGRSIASDAVIFNYDVRVSDAAFFALGLSDDEDDYSVTKYDNVLDSDKVTAFYVYDNDDKEIKAMLLADVTSSQNVYGLISGAGKNNSDAGAYFDLFVDGKDASYNGDDTLIKKDDKALYRIKFDASGDIKDFEKWNSSSDDTIAVKVTGVVASESGLNSRTFTYTDGVSGSSITTDKGNSGQEPTAAGGKWTLTLDRDVIVYVWDADDDEWQIGSTSDIRNMADGYDVVFYDIIDEDGVYDVVLIDQIGGNRISL